jgi:hypothetical protein
MSKKNRQNNNTTNTGIAPVGIVEDEFEEEQVQNEPMMDDALVDEALNAAAPINEETLAGEKEPEELAADDVATTEESEDILAPEKADDIIDSDLKDAIADTEENREDVAKIEVISEELAEGQEEQEVKAADTVIPDSKKEPEAISAVETEEDDGLPFNKTKLLKILDEAESIDASTATIYNTADDMIAVAKLNKILKALNYLGTNNPIYKVMSQALKFANTTADKRKGDMLYGTLIREINSSVSGNDFDLLMFTVIKTFKSLRTLGEMNTIRSFREVKNVELAASALSLSHLLAQLSTAEDRKNKINVTISLDKLLRVSSNGLSQNGINLVKEYFTK